jgi:hypothetical protein
MILARILLSAFVASCLTGMTPHAAHAQPDKAARAEALARILAEDIVGWVLHPFNPEKRYDADCTAESGKNAEQCHAFVSRMRTETATIIFAEESAVRSALAPFTADLNKGLAELSDDDLKAMERNAVPSAEVFKRHLSSEGVKRIDQPHLALWSAASKEQQRLSALFDDMFDRVIRELMADPALQ